MATVVLTRPIGGGESGIPGTIIQGTSIAPGDTITVDSVGGESVKWLYTIIDTVAEQVLTAEVVANHNFGTEPRWNRYGLVGDSMSHLVDVTVSGTVPSLTLELNMTNNHPTNTITINIVRIQLQP